MKIAGAKKIHYDSGPNMTPLVDIVMVILIFLMLAGSFVGAEHYLVSNLPLSQTGAGNAQLPPGFIPDEPIDIRVDSPTPDAFVATAGRIKARGSDARVVRHTDCPHPLAGAIKPDELPALRTAGRAIRHGHRVGDRERASRDAAIDADRVAHRWTVACDRAAFWIEPDRPQHSLAHDQHRKHMLADDDECNERHDERRHGNTVANVAQPCNERAREHRDCKPAAAYAHRRHP